MVNKKKEKNNIENIIYVWGQLCSLSSIDQEKNNVSLFNMIDQFNLPKVFFEAQKKQGKNLLFPSPCEIVLCWKRMLDISISNEEISADSKIKLIDPQGVVLHEILIPIKFPRGINIFRSRIYMQGMWASVFGRYVYQIEMKSPSMVEFKKVGDILFEVTERQLPLKI